MKFQNISDSEFAERIINILPGIFDLRMDPYERADEESDIYHRWHQENQYLAFLAAPPLVNFVKTFAEFPPFKNHNPLIRNGLLN